MSGALYSLNHVAGLLSGAVCTVTTSGKVVYEKSHHDFQDVAIGYIMRQLIDAKNLMVTSTDELTFIHNGQLTTLRNPPDDINEGTDADNAWESVATQSTPACHWSTCRLCMNDCYKNQEKLECISLIFLNFYVIFVLQRHVIYIGRQKEMTCPPSLSLLRLSLFSYFRFVSLLLVFFCFILLGLFCYHAVNYSQVFGDINNDFASEVSLVFACNW